MICSDPTCACPRYGQADGESAKRHPMRCSEPKLDVLFDRLRAIFPRLNPPDRRVSLQIYRLLARGEPVGQPMLAARLQLSADSVQERLNRLWGLEWDDRDRIIGFRGLGLRSTRHRFEFDGKILYAWCAWDTLFLPEILQVSACVESRCEAARTRIRLALNPERVERVEPLNAVISFPLPEAARVRENPVGHFCRFVHFFASGEAGRDWTARHPRAFLLTIDEAHQLGRRINAVQYGAVARRRGKAE